MSGNGDSEEQEGKTVRMVTTTYRHAPYQTEQAEDITVRLIPEWLDLFLEKNASYQEVGNELGPAGVFPDINRKVGKIKLAVWLGRKLPGEPVREVILDLIGHLFLLLHMIDTEHEHIEIRDGVGRVVSPERGPVISARPWGPGEY